MKLEVLKSVPALGLGLLVGCASFAALNSTAAAEDHAAMGMEAKVILKTTVTATDQPIQFSASGKPEVTSMVITIEPGGHTSLHRHPVSLVAVYVLEGALETHVGDVVRSYKPGDVVLEPTDTPMQAFNPGSTPTKLFGVVVGEEGKPISVSAE